MKKVYPAILTHNDDAILVEIPDLEICTQGYALAEAIEMTRDAIGLSIVSDEDVNEEIPEPSKIEDINIREGKFYKEGYSFLSLVDINLVEYRRKNDIRINNRNITVIYPACFYPEENGQYSIVFPDLNNIATYGNDLEDALKTAADLLCTWVLDSKKDKEELPQPSNIKDVKPDSPDGFVNLVVADIDEYTNSKTPPLLK